MLAEHTGTGTLSGVYAGAADPGRASHFARWRGAPVTIVGDFLGDADWSVVTNPDWLLDGWQPFRRAGGTLVLAVPLLVRSPAGDFVAGARGDYDDHFGVLASRLVHAGFGASILRLGPEFNGSWEPYALAPDGPNCSEHFIAYWRRLVDLFRAEPGADFRFDWNVNLGRGTAAPDAAYPGDDYVDVVGVDVYDRGWDEQGGPVPRDADRWQQIRTQPYGLDDWLAFSRRHGKPISVPEWALAPLKINGGADSPFFIDAMSAWMADARPAYELYFNYGDWAIDSGSYPQAGERYRARWGLGSVRQAEAEPGAGDAGA